MNKYKYERDGQIDFYNMFLPRIDYSLCIDDILSDNHDGIINGNLLEFKKNVTDLNSALFQCIKYLSSLRIKGKPIPATILIIDVNASTVWVYHSEKYLVDIEKVYLGSASINNKGFISDTADFVLHYDNPIDIEKIVSILKETNFTKIHIDENCIVGWATSYYNSVPTARKEDFIGDDTGKHRVIGEIRNPVQFAEYIYPYTGKTNVKFNYLMDRLNDTLQKKTLGAFYTHKLYAEKSLELLRKAISRVPKGNDYIILDRCAGTGNLEMYMTDEELSHCIVSTIEYYEYKVLEELLGSKVRHIVPPIEVPDTFNAGLVRGADALSYEYISYPTIKQYIDDPHCTIILFENPPFVETMTIEWHKKRKSVSSSVWKNSYVVQQMKEKLRGKVNGQATNDIGNAFIWSGFEYYLRQPTDSYIVYSPVKYWKYQHLVNKQFLGGFAFNRRHFHTKIDACIMCALWSNVDDFIDKFNLIGYDIKDNCLIKHDTPLPIKRINTIFSNKYYDNNKREGDTLDGILVGLDGREASDTVKKRIAPRYSDDILGYLVADSSGFDNPDTHSSLLVAGRYNGNGFYLRKDNYLEKLPMFCASRYITYNRSWTERARIMKSADGSNRFFHDIVNGRLQQFLLKCLLFTCMETQNHMRTFWGRDGRFYRNELCLDCTNGETIAFIDIKRLLIGTKEQAILQQWDTILKYAKETDKYDSSLSYGVYQISDEIDMSYKDEITGETVWQYKELHSSLITLKILVKDYYNSEIVPVLFEYEFLK